jgi:hypothetical protein
MVARGFNPWKVPPIIPDPVGVKDVFLPTFNVCFAEKLIP